jgi:hexokinase
MSESVENSKFVETPDYARIRDAFCLELTKSARGEQTSLPFIHNRLPAKPLVKANEVFQVFVIGGTNGETATVKYSSDSTVTIKDHKPHPELTKFKTSEDFLTFIDNHAAADTNAIGLNFAFTLLPKTGDKGQLDGVMVSGDTKGHAFEGLQNELVGTTVEKYFKRIHKRDIVVSIGNDTVCLIASATEKGTDRGVLFAGIVGTGYNMAFFLDDRTIINVQASDFTGFTPTTSGKIVDQESHNVGEQLYNKEVAAGELYKHYNALINTLSLESERLQSSKDLANMASNNPSKEGEVARQLFKRSASLVAAQFAGFYNFKGRPQKLTAIMQGGLFWEGPNYRDMVTEELVRLGVPKEAMQFKQIEQSDVLGAAKLITGGL